MLSGLNRLCFHICGLLFFLLLVDGLIIIAKLSLDFLRMWGYVVSVVLLFSPWQDVVRRYGASLRDPAAAAPVSYDTCFDRLLKEAENGNASGVRRTPPSTKVRSIVKLVYSNEQICSSLFLLCIPANHI